MKRLSFGMVLALTLGISSPIDASILDKQAHTFIENPSTSLIAAKTNSGSFVGVDHPTQGRVNIIEEDGIKYLEISSDFQTDEGPALEVILHNSPVVSTKVQEGEYVNLGKLKAVSGSQRYQIPQDLNLDEYQSVAIWCQEFNVTFGYATLK